MRESLKLLPGLVAVGLLATLAVWLSGLFHLSTNLMALLLGFLVANLYPFPNSFQPGIKWSESQALALAVGLLGLQLNLKTLLAVDSGLLLLVSSALLLTFVSTWLLAKVLSVGSSTAGLVASGQGICGTAAIMASQKIIKAPATHVGLVVAMVNFLGFLGVFLLPVLAYQILPHDNNSGGILIGNTLQSMGHVVAAGFALDETNGQFAVLVKMVRILFLIPVLLVMIYWMRSSDQKYDKPASESIHWLQLVPWFIWLFLLLVTASSLQWLPLSVIAVLNQVADALFFLAMVAIGLSIQIKHIWHHGGKLLLLGALVFVIQLAYSLLVLINFH